MNPHTRPRRDYRRDCRRDIPQHRPPRQQQEPPTDVVGRIARLPSLFLGSFMIGLLLPFMLVAKWLFGVRWDHSETHP